MSITVIFSLVSFPSFAIDEFIPVLRFVVASDVHIGDYGTIKEEKRLAKLFETSYSYSDSQRYNKIDGVFFVGDISDRGTSSSLDKFFNIVNTNARNETKTRAVLGNHEFYTESASTISRFLSSSGYSESDTDFVLGGFHFIMLCPDNGGKGFSSAQKSWLKKDLLKMLKRIQRD